MPSYPKLAKRLQEIYEDELTKARANGRKLPRRAFPNECLHLGLDERSQWFYKLTGGESVTIPDGLREALRGYGIDDAAFEDLLGASDEEGGGAAEGPVYVKIISAYAIWASALVLAAQRGRLAHYDVATHMRGADKHHEPVWIRESATLAGAVEDERLIGRSVMAFVESLHERDPQAVILAAFTHELIESKRDANFPFRRVATVLDSGAVTLVVRMGGEAFHLHDMLSTAEVAAALPEGESLLLAPEGTVAWNRGLKIRDLARDRYPEKKKVSLVGVDLRQLRTLCHPEGASKGALLTVLEAAYRKPVWGILLWEPMAQEVLQQDELIAYPLYHFAERGEPPRPITCDLYVYNSGYLGNPAWQKHLRRVLRRLVGEVLPELQNCGDLIADWVRDEMRLELQRLGAHFGLRDSLLPYPGTEIGLPGVDLQELFGQLRVRAYPDLRGLELLGCPVLELGDDDG